MYMNMDCSVVTSLIIAIIVALFNVMLWHLIIICAIILLIIIYCIDICTLNCRLLRKARTFKKKHVHFVSQSFCYIMYHVIVMSGCWVSDFMNIDLPILDLNYSIYLTLQ